MGRAEYWDPTTQSRKPIKSGSIVDDTGLEYAPSDVKAIDDKIGILNGAGATKEKANKQDLDAHEADDATIKHKGKEIGLEDTANNFTNKNVEGAMNELFTNVSDGKDLVGGAITGVDDSVEIPADPTFQNLAAAIGGISTGVKFASGMNTPVSGYQKEELIINGLDFIPRVVFGSDSKARHFLYSTDATFNNQSILVAGTSKHPLTSSFSGGTFILRSEMHALNVYVTYAWIAIE